MEVMKRIEYLREDSDWTALLGDVVVKINEIIDAIDELQTEIQNLKDKHETN